MKSDPKTNSSRRDAGSQAARAIEKLLERISAQSDDPGPAQQVMADLNRLIEDVRRQYRILADRQVQAALEAALAVEPEDERPAQARQSGDGDVLDALEALIHGEEEMFKAAAYSLRPPAVTYEMEAFAKPPAATVNETNAAPESPQSEPSEATGKADEESEELLFEGTVRLQVYPGGSLQRVLRFVDDMGKRPQFRVLRMSGNPQREGAEIDLGLREPLPLLELLWDMGHTAEPVDGKGDGIPMIAVHLYAAKAAQR